MTTEEGSSLDRRTLLLGTAGVVAAGWALLSQPGAPENGTQRPADSANKSRLQNDPSGLAGNQTDGGWVAGADNGVSDTNARGLKLPAKATQINVAGDWASIFIVQTGGDRYSTAATGRETIASSTAGSATSGNLAAGTGSGMLFRSGANKRLYCQRNNAGSGGADFFPVSPAGAPIDTKVVLDDHRGYVIVVGQKGDFAYVRACDIDSGVLQGYDHPTTNRNSSRLPNFYLDAKGKPRSGASLANLDNFLDGLGCWHQTTSRRNGWGGIFGSFAHCWAAPDDAQIQAIANGTLGIGALPSLRYWNRMKFTTGPDVPAETADIGGATLPVSSPAMLAKFGTLDYPGPGGPLVGGGLIRLQREHAQYVFPMFPGRATGRVWWDGDCMVDGYDIWGRLPRADGSGDLLPWTQLVQGASVIGLFSLYYDGIPPGVTFRREIWIGPANGNPDDGTGQTVVDYNPMQLGLRHLVLGQSQRVKQLQNGTGNGGTGATLAAKPAAGTWWLTSYPHLSDSDKAVNVLSGPMNSVGPRRVDTVKGIIGDGMIARMQRISDELGWALHIIHLARAGHSLDAFAYDRSQQQVTATGTGAGRTASLITPGISDPSNLRGVEPGSINITWLGGQITDAENASLSGAPQLTTPQTFSSPICSASINYSTGALSLSFAGDPGPVKVAWVTRFDTGDGAQTNEASPDKFTLFGNTAANGVISKTMATVAPRHGLSSWEWGGMTSNVGQFNVSTEALLIAARDSYGARLDILRDRVWNLAAKTNPPLIMQVYGRGSGGTSNNNARRAQFELSLSKPYDPSSASDGSSGATAENYRWHGGMLVTSNLSANTGEHQTNGQTGGMRIGELEGLACASLMQADQSKARGPEFLVANRRQSDNSIIELTPVFHRQTASSLIVDTVNGGDAARLPDWYVLINPPTLKFLSDRSTETPLDASYNQELGCVELKRKSGIWPDPVTNRVYIRAHCYGPFLHDTGVAQNGGTAYTVEDERAMASSLWDNAGGFTWSPGAEMVPIFMLRVSA